MVGKRPCTQGGKKHTPSSPRRPKRNVPVKTIDDTVGLSKKEEKELKKALYASLQETKLKVTYTYEKVIDRRHSGSRNGSHSAPASKTNSRRTSTVTSSSTTTSMDESSQDSVKSYTSTNTTATSTSEPIRAKVHAQRKFAQGSLPVTPSTTPVKAVTSPFKLLPKTPKTEDFITFLCLRGTSVLPPHLDFLKYSGDESNESSKTETSNSCKQPETLDSKTEEITRESTPESSSASSNDELYQLHTPSPSTRNGGISSALRKAARASASTPETARGIVSLRQGLSRKASSLAQTPPSSRSRSLLSTPDKSSPSSRKHTSLSSKQRLGVKRLTKSFSDYSPKRKEAGILKSASTSKLVSKKNIFGRENKRRPIKDKKSGKAIEPLRTRRMKTDDPDSKNVGGRLSRKSSTSDTLSLSLDSGLRGKRSIKSRSESFDSSNSPSRKIPKRRSSSRVKSLTHQRRLQHYGSENEIDDEDVFGVIDDLDSDNKKRGRPKGSKNKKSFGMAMSTRRSVFLQKSAKKLTSAGKLATKRKIAAMNTLKKSSVKEQKKLSNMIEKRRHIKSISSDTKESPVHGKSIERTNKATRIRNSPSTSKTSPRSTRKHSVSPKRNPPEHRYGLRSEMVDLPVYHPTDQEFRDPLTYIESIRCIAESYGMCKIVPPSSWKPDCRINDDMRFTAQVQYTHRLYKRWGPNVEKTECILKYLRNIGVDFDSIPKIGSVDLDLPKLSQIIQDHGGMQNVIDKKKWIKIADLLNIPKMAVDRGTKLFDAYCKYLLPYDTLSLEEKRKVKQQVLAEKQKKEEMNEIDDGVVKGKSSPLSAFIRIARNVHSMWFKDEPTVEQMESEYWKILEEGKKHVVVQCGHVNTKTQGTAFPTRHDNSYTRHSWNLNNLPQNSKSLLKVLGPITGTTIPTLHIGMLFATSCWSCNPHNLPYIQYLHTGADIVWYAVSKQHESKLKEAMLKLTPDLISEDPQWLKEDVVMIKPELLLEKDVPVGKCIQKPQEFVVIFDKSFTATVSCGYNVSESAHYATTNWLPLGIQAAQDLNGSFERELFSMDALLYNLCTSDSVDKDVLSVAFEYLEKTITEEISLRRQVYDNGLKIFERMAVCDDNMMSTYPRKRQQDLLECDENICDISKKICYLSMVTNDVEKSTLCLNEALQHLGKKKNLKFWRLLYRYTDEELKQVLENTKKKLSDTPSKRRISRKFE